MEFERACSKADSKKLEHGCRLIYADVPSFCWFGVGVRSCSNFLASTVDTGSCQIIDPVSATAEEHYGIMLV